MLKKKPKIIDGIYRERGKRRWIGEDTLLNPKMPTGSQLRDYFANVWPCALALGLSKLIIGAISHH